MAIFGKSKKKKQSLREVRDGDVLATKYLIERCIGEGGFSRIFRGVQLSTGQQVAIKLLNAAEIDPIYRDEMQTRFRREMAAYSKLRHPNLVRLIDSGHLSDDVLFLVLEYLEGRSLAHIIYDDGPLEPFEAKHLMGQCIDALAAAHAQGIAHRDFKPSNVHIVQTGTQRNAVVLDFGLAGPTDSWQSMVANRVTRPGTLVGSVSYMAPEQIRGEVTIQSDIYAWGLVFIECLTGRKAVTGKTRYDVVMRHVEQDVVLPAPIAAHPLGDILKKATARNLEDRYCNAELIVRQLTVCSMASLDLHAAPPPPPNEAPEIPSYVPEDMKYLALLPEPVEDHPLSSSELDTLFRNYARALRKHGKKVPTKSDFFEFVELNAEHWRQRLDCKRVDYEIVEDATQVRLKPIPIF